MSLTTVEAARTYLEQTGICPDAVLSVNEQGGGYSSYTFRLETPGGRYFLKHTAGHQKGAPHLASDPEEYDREVAAYQVLGGYLAQAVMPRLVASDPANRTLLLTDALPSARSTLKDVIHEQRWPLAPAGEIGYHIGRLHGDAYAGQPTILGREQDARRYDQLVRWLSSDLQFNQPATQEAIEAKAAATAYAQTTLIMGDLAPRNIMTDEQTVAFVDLAYATRGTPAFDIGFLAGHLLLNAIEFERLRDAGRFLDSLHEAYAKGLSDSRSADTLAADAVFAGSKIFAAGWMHRRNFQPIQPEVIPDHEQQQVEQYIARLALDDAFGY
jgi:tRNA A-37 threonylcarbamoyl transferase component Bud32